MMKRWTAMVGLAVLSVAGCGYARPGHYAGMMDQGTMMAPGSGMMGAPRAAPPTEDAASPDNDSPDGARLTQQFCGVCHVPPRPAQHSPEQWPLVVQRMRYYRHNYGLPDMTDQQLKAILDYLQGKAPGR